MKKLFLSLGLIGGLAILPALSTSAEEVSEVDNTVKESISNVVVDEEVATECEFGREDCAGLGNGECDGTGKQNRDGEGKRLRLGKGNCDGSQRGEGQGRGNCGK